MGVSMLETDVEVDFAAPVGYVEPASSRASGTSTPRSIANLPAGGMLHNQGTMAQAINYDAIAPNSTAVLAGQKAVSSNFLLGGHKLSSKKGAKAPTPKASTPVAGISTNPPPPVIRRTNGPQPLRLAPNKLFFGYEIKPVKTQADRDKENADARQPHFAGQGQTLKGGKVKEVKEEKVEEVKPKGTGAEGRRLDGKDRKG
jgi:ubiquitin fusion degradation protein 1